MTANFEARITNFSTEQLEGIAAQAKKTLDFAPMSKEQRDELIANTAVIWRELHSRYAARLDGMAEPQF
jgi:hypothetical protein